MSDLIVVTEGQIVAGTEYQIALADLAERAKGITVVGTPEQYEQAVEVCAKSKSITRGIIAAAEPALIEARNAVNELRAMRDKMIHAFDAITDPLEKMATDWKASERRAAALEQATLNKKRNGQEVLVMPNIPSVSGTRAHVNYSAEVVDADKLLAAFIGASMVRTKQMRDRTRYLRQFITIDEKALNAEARKIKNAKTLESLIPGIRGIEEDRI